MYLRVKWAIVGPNNGMSSVKPFFDIKLADCWWDLWENISIKFELRCTFFIQENEFYVPENGEYFFSASMQ